MLGGPLGTAALQCGWRGIDTGVQQDRSRWRLGLTLIGPAQSAGCVGRAAADRVHISACAGRSRGGVCVPAQVLPAADFQCWGGGAARGGGLPHAHARPPGQRGGQAAAAGPARGTSPGFTPPSRPAGHQTPSRRSAAWVPRVLQGYATRSQGVSRVAHGLFSGHWETNSRSGTLRARPVEKPQAGSLEREAPMDSPFSSLPGIGIRRCVMGPRSPNGLLRLIHKAHADENPKSSEAAKGRR